MTKTPALENVIAVKRTMSFVRVARSFTRKKAIVETVSAVIQPSLTSEPPLGIHSFRQELSPRSHDILLHLGADQRGGNQAGSSHTLTSRIPIQLVTDKRMSPLQRLFKRILQSLEKDALANLDYEDMQEDGRDGFYSRFERRAMSMEFHHAGLEDDNDS